MQTDMDIQDIKDDVDRLAEKYTDQADDIKDSIDKLVAEYEDRIDSLEEQLYEKEQELANVNLEDYASSMLQTFTGHEPNMGEVLALKEDLEKLLTTKYNVSLGNL